MSDTIHVEHRPPEAVFALLGNETRVDILRALAEADGPRSFSALRERVGMRDSGQFNYHLGKLVGTFVTDGEAGYELSMAGRQVVGAVIAGTYTAEATMEPIAVDDPCPTCGKRPLVATYEDEHARLECPTCEEWQNRFGFPPGTLDQYAPEELPAAFDRWMYSLFERITSGFCANCAGRLAGVLDTEADPFVIRWICERCGDEARSSATSPLLYHPATQGFFYDHGIDPTATPSWRLVSMRDIAEERTDDGRVAVTITLDGDTLSAHIETDGTVTDVERSDRDPAG
ncbi:ArsR/SmtB family transcription factor [Natronomonas sp. EA1]|uniref:ArsR/SmtB family transcription factor n=1 Tax=Natronomonas sp. EA1 TaxID=3421655 RepID=UPI003EBBBFF0